MTTQPLKDAVREHVQDRQLSEAQLQDLEALMAPQDNKQEPATTPSSPRRPLFFIVGALAAVALGIFLWQATQDVKSPLESIAAEVARNHLKLKPLEVQGDSVSKTRSFFTKLNFQLLNKSSVVDAQPWTLQGGRYCSIQGYDAAQLRYTNTAQEQTVSVYMAPYKPDTMGALPRVSEGEKPARVTINGLDVWIWVERDVLLAATPVPPETL